LFFQLCTLECVHILPGVARRNARVLLIRRLGILIRHFQKDEGSKVFQIISVGNTVIPEGIAQAPDLGDYG
jgi:hypothetical protein